jgi:hypothetical protein
MYNMWPSVGSGVWSSPTELTTVRSIDWAREVRKGRTRRALMKVVSILIGPVVRCGYCGQRGGILFFDRVESQIVWRCLCCRHGRNGRVY